MRAHPAVARVLVSGLAVLAGAAALAGCGGGDPAGPRVEPPTAPAENDLDFAVFGLHDWYLVGNPLTPGQDQVAIEVEAPDGTDTIDVWVAGRAGVRLDRVEGELFATTLPVGDLGPGIHDLLLAANGETTAFAKLAVRRSHAFYVLVTTDWDFSDPSTQALDRQDEMHVDHPELLITHFAGPYTFTDPEVLPARQTELATWLQTQRDTFGDEIGLHIHPWCHFVEAALGVGNCIIDQSTVYATDATGYTVKDSAYTEAQFGTLLDKADELFAANGLGKPTTFRAGGWTASIDTLRALAGHGFVADTSALNWARLEEWIGLGTGELYRWNMEHWAPINDTSQPYWINMDDPLSSAAPTLPLLEVPDNGIMVDYVSVDEMKTIFAANWDGVTPLQKPTTMMMGFHPAAQFGQGEHGRVDGFLDHADFYLASQGLGPVVYATLNQMPAVFPR